MLSIIAATYLETVHGNKARGVGDLYMKYHRRGEAFF